MDRLERNLHNRDGENFVQLLKVGTVLQSFVSESALALIGSNN
jgi:hypothetical protein